MKKFVLVLMLAFGLTLSAGQASAHFLWMEPICPLGPLNLGDNVSVNVYLHAEHDDGLQMWEIELGFDDTAVDGDELTLDPYPDPYRTTYIEYGNTVLSYGFLDEEYVQGGSEKHPGGSRIDDIAKQDLLISEMLTAGEDFLLFSAHFMFDGGVWDGEDVWLEAGDGFGFDEAGWIWGLLPVYTDNSGVTLLDDGGPDYAAVPIPATLWLLGSGLLGLIGIHRSKS